MQRYLKLPIALSDPLSQYPPILTDLRVKE